jgi:hypothetical protein
MQASFRDFHDGVFTSPLSKARIVEINEGSNGKRHDKMNAPNDFFIEALPAMEHAVRARPREA